MALVKFAEVGATGFNLDASPNDVPVQPFGWTGGSNIRFKDGYAEKFGGHTAPNGSPVVTPYGVFFTNTASGLYEVYTGLQKVYAVNNTTHTNITRQTAGADVNYTGTTSNKWTGCTLADVLILNNGVDDPQYWNGNPATKLQALSAWPANTKAKVIRSFDGALVALNVTESGTNYKSMVRVSTPADPGALPASWDYTDQTNESIRVEGKLAQTPDAIVDGLELGSLFMIYKENSTYAMRYTGGEFVYAFDNISRESGALGIDCAAAFPGGHAVLSDGDIVINQGTEGPQSIIDRRMRKWLFNNLDSDNRQRSFAVTYRLRNEIWFCFPAVDQTWPNMAAVWNYKENTWGIRELPNLSHANTGLISGGSTDSWDSRTETWDETEGVWSADLFSQTTKRLIMASTDAGLYLADAGKTFNGTPMAAYLERTGIDFKEQGLGPDRVKLCKGVRLRVDAAAGTVVRVYVGYQNDVEDAIDWGSAMEFIVGTDKKVDCLVSGVFLAVKFEAVAQNDLRIGSFDMDIEDIGEAF